MVTTNGVFLIANRYYIDTLAWIQINLPIVLRNTRYDIIVGKSPSLAHIAVFNPDVCVLLSKAELANSILHKDTGVRFTIVVHNLTLIVHQILNSQRR